MTVSQETLNWLLSGDPPCACWTGGERTRLKHQMKEKFMANFNPDHKAVLDDLLLSHELVRAGQMFGYPAYYAGKKMCICLYEDGVGIKLPEASANRLLDQDVHANPFQPLGRRRMREWVQIDLEDSQDYRAYLAVFEESIRYVLSHQGMDAAAD